MYPGRNYQGNIILRRRLLRSHSFVSAAKKIVKKDPRQALELQNALELLSNNAFDVKLKTHKLKGSMKGSLASSIGYDLRIIFKLVKNDDSEAILLETIGTHDEVY